MIKKVTKDIVEHREVDVLICDNCGFEEEQPYIDMHKFTISDPEFSTNFCTVIFRRNGNSVNCHICKSCMIDASYILRKDFIHRLWNDKGQVKVDEQKIRRTNNS